jgi:N-acetylneuraminate synthase/N,N'-diacetyllegionaminate synthase
MDSLASAFGYDVGWSDHTLGDAVTLAAVARGARVIEKHFTIAKDMAGPDHLMSLDPGELTSMIDRIRMVESSLGDGRKRPVEAEKETMVVARRSLFAARDVAAGAVLTVEDFVALRPGDGLSPVHQKTLVGRRARAALTAGEKLALTHVE